MPKYALIAQSHSHRHHALPAVPQSLFARPAEQVAPELIGSLLLVVKAKSRSRLNITYAVLTRYWNPSILSNPESVSVRQILD